MGTSASGADVPRILYGTAWKEDATGPLVERALAMGFRGIDTANQRKHYFEAAVGDAVAAAIARGDVRRDELFLQTKFTYVDGQDHRLPYDPAADVRTQVQQSFASSLEHLHVDTIDSYVLHGPSRSRGLAKEDWQAWEAMESLHDEERARFLGVSNVDPAQLDELCRRARVRPSFVQNRCYATRGWDAKVREVAAYHGVRYQGFSLLTANAGVLASATLRSIATRHGCTPAEVVFRFARAVGMLPLTGTTDPRHMKEDLAASTMPLDADEVRKITAIVE